MNTKIIAAVTVGIATLYGFAGSAWAVADEDVVDAVSAGGTNMADTMKAIAFALIPLALGVLVARKGWKIVRGFF